MPILTIKDLPEGSGSLTADDIFLFMDDPIGSGITKKITLSQIASILSGGVSVIPENLFDQELNTYNFPTFSGVSLSSGLIFPDGSEQNRSADTTSIFNLGSISGANAIDYSNNKMIQTLSLNGNSTTFTKGGGWSSDTNVSQDVMLRISASEPTPIIWSIVTDWFDQPDPGPLSSGVHLVLLRSIGTSILEGHYLGNKTN